MKRSFIANNSTDNDITIPYRYQPTEIQAFNIGFSAETYFKRASVLAKAKKELNTKRLRYEGIVKNSVTGTPIQGASVKFAMVERTTINNLGVPPLDDRGWPPVLTNEKGRFSFIKEVGMHHITDDYYVVVYQVEKAGYKTLRLRITDRPPNLRKENENSQNLLIIRLEPND